MTECVNMKTQSCELLRGTHLSDEERAEAGVEKDCAESYKA